LYEDAVKVLGDIKLGIQERMLGCMRILEDAADCGMLKQRQLENVKRTAAAAKLTKNGKGKKLDSKPSRTIATTGISFPSFVDGQPVPPEIGVQSLAYIADTLKGSKAAFEDKRPHVCPVDKCTSRYVKYDGHNGLVDHMKKVHKGYPIPPNAVAIVEVQMSAGGVAATTDAAPATASRPTAPAPSVLGSAYIACPCCRSFYPTENHDSHMLSSGHVNAIAAAAVAAAAAAAAAAAVDGDDDAEKYIAESAAADAQRTAARAVARADDRAAFDATMAAFDADIPDNVNAK
jgi:hypothetical protein